MSTGAPRAAARTEWVDAARGLCILLVVFLHTQGALVAFGFDDPRLDTLNRALATVRMPTFFLISGLFARPLLSAPRREFARRRPGHFAYLYVVWGAVTVLVAASVGAALGTGAGAAAAASGSAWLLVSGVLWYFPALALFFLAARATRSVPLPVQLGVALALFVPTSLGLVTTGSWGLDHMLALYVFFLVGTQLRTAVLGFAARATPPRVALLGAGWVALGVVLWRWDPTGRVGFLLLPWAGVPALVGATALASARLPLRRLCRLGRATLPVYVLHPLLLAVGVGVATAAGPPRVAVPVAAQLAVAVVAAAVVAGLCALAGVWLGRVRWLVGLPVWRGSSAPAKK